MTRQRLKSVRGAACPSPATPRSTFCQVSPLCHPLGLGGRPGLLRPGRQVGRPLASSPLWIRTQHGWLRVGWSHPLRVPRHPWGALGCPFSSVCPPCLLFAQGFPKQYVKQYFRGRAGSQTGSRVKFLILHLGKILVLSGIYFSFFFFLICKIELKIPTLQVAMMIKAVVLNTGCTSEFPGEPQNANA